MASKSKSRRRVFRASCILAALIVAGSSFAWFTSKDEVTNRLSATTDYGVAIAENFQPPENWVPGQAIAKDAGATNTGNVDAFVRMWLDGSIRTLQQHKGSASDKVAAYIPATSSATGLFTTPTTAATDDKIVNADFTMQDDSGYYYKTLDVSQTQNPAASVSTDNYGYAEKFSGPYSEVQAMQTGILAYAPNNAEYTYVLNEETNLKIYLTSTVGDDVSPTTDYRYVNVPKGTLVHVGTTGTPTAATLTDGKLTISAEETVTSTSGANNDTTFKTVYVQTQSHMDGADDPKKYFTPVNVEYESFTPLTDGLYLFLRNEDDANQTNPEFSGYYRSTQNVTDPSTNTTTTDKVTIYYALNTNTPGTNDSDYTVNGAKTADYANPIKVTYDADDKNIRYVEPTDNLELFTAKYQNANANSIYWYYTAPVTTGTKAPAMIHAVYHPDGVSGTDAIVFNPNKDIVVDIALANIFGASDDATSGITNTAESWTPISSVDASNSFKWAADDTQSAFSVSGKASDLKFYYDNDLESGDTSAKLVDYVVLNKNVTNKAFLGFDFDLGVHLDSVQVTYAEDGTESALAVGNSSFSDAGTAGTVGSETWKGASGEKGGAAVSVSAVTDKEITQLTWVADNAT